MDSAGLGFCTGDERDGVVDEVLRAWDRERVQEFRCRKRKLFLDEACEVIGL